MKKNYLMMAAFATALAFTACSSEEEIPAAGSENGTMGLTEDVIEIAISNTGVGSTRAARPVGSSAADNNVNKVKLVFFAADSTTPVTLGSGSGQLNLTVVDGESGYSISDGVISYTSADVAEGVPGTTDREEKVAKIKVSGLTASTTYTIVAYGYNGDSFPYGTETQVVGKYYYQTGTHSLSGSSLEEVFAAKTTAKTTANLGTAETPVVKFTSSVRIELTRQVAGMLAYFKNVPATIDGDKVTKVTVEANDKSKGFYFPAAVWGEEAGKHAEFNGIDDETSSGNDVLLTFTIDGETQIDQENNTYKFGTDEEGKRFQLADEVSSNAPADLVCEDNTLFGGRFILPYSQHITTGDATLVVKLQGDGGKVLKTLKVTTSQFKSDLSGTKYLYDILCNNFYSIGKKMATDSTEGGTDPEDPDEPADLSSTDEITVLINDAWEVIHDMGLE